jgi:Flp pilus assembly protein TadG
MPCRVDLMHELTEKSMLRDVPHDDAGPVQSREAARRARDEGGFVLVWFALIFVVLVAMAGFGVDVWKWWYTGQQAQRAADAGSLAGVPFMPLDFPQARSKAIAEAGRNKVTVQPAGVEQGERPNQLKVTASIIVDNTFTSIFGLKTTTITRVAVAEYNAPLQMGSPAGFLGNDPENGATAKHWLNIGAPNIDKRTGDRYADYRNCTAGFGCGGGLNIEYLDGSYFIAVDVGAGAVGGSLAIQAYDPVYANGGGGTGSCQSNWPSAANLTTLVGQGYADANTRYQRGTTSGANDWCTGDDNTGVGGGATPQATAWVVRAPDPTPFNPADNPPVSGCSRQYKGYDQAFFPLLDKTSATYANDAASTPYTFASAFHRWVTLCTIGSAVEGKYFIQVRSHLPYPTGDLTRAFSAATDANIYGQNRYAVRTVLPGTSTVAPNVATYTDAHLPMYVNTGTAGATPNFYLTRVLPGGGASGRNVQLQFFDIGDVGCASPAPAGCGVTTVTISPPTDRSGDPPTCEWAFDNGSPIPGSAVVGGTNGCTLSNITNAAFDGHLVRVKIKVPGNYGCGSGPGAPPAITPNDCWFRIQMSYTPGTVANDTTTWDASIGGDPVRLIQ